VVTTAVIGKTSEELGTDEPVSALSTAPAQPFPAVLSLSMRLDITDVRMRARIDADR